jgi:hypothetical protein
MENRFDFITGVVAVCVAGYAAVMLDYVAHDDLGFSSAQIGPGERLDVRVILLRAAGDKPAERQGEQGGMTATGRCHPKFDNQVGFSNRLSAPATLKWSHLNVRNVAFGKDCWLGKILTGWSICLDF